jgi:glycosyltransferase involved in cell wall biosynthesis
MSPRKHVIMATIADLGAANGPAFHFLNLAQAFEQQGLRVTVVCPPLPKGPIMPVPNVTLQIAGHRSHSIPGPSAKVVPAMMLCLARQPKPDGVFLRSGVGTWPLLGITKRWSGVSTIVDTNGWFENELTLLGQPRFVSSIFGWMQRREGLAATHVRTVTDLLAQKIAAAGVPANRISVIGNGVDLSVFRPLDRTTARATLDQLETRPLLGLISNLWPAIDLRTVLQGMKILIERGRPVSLIIGGDGRSRSAFEADAEAILGSAAGSVRWLGSVSQTRANEILNGVDVALAPFVRARNEITGLSPLKVRECAAAGRPIVATDLPGLRELGTEPWVFLAAPGDPVAMADAIERALAADPTLVAAAAREKAEQEFAWPIIARQVTNLMFPGL